MAIGVCYAALRAEIAHRGRSLDAWRGDHLLARQYDRIALPGQRDPEPVLPDASCRIDDRQIFVEVDRGTRPLRSWQAKVRAYEAYRGSNAKRERSGDGPFQVLIVASTLTRARRIAETIAGVTRDNAPTYLLLTEDRVHPTTIRRGWLGIDAVTWETCRVVDNVTLVPRVTLGPRALWEHP